MKKNRRNAGGGCINMLICSEQTGYESLQKAALVV